MSWSRVKALLEDGVRKGVFSAAQAGIWDPRSQARTLVAGATSYEPDAKRVTAATLFDLASLTKVLATTTMIARLLDQKFFSLEDTLVSDFPNLPWNSAYTAVTLRDVLCHQAGFAAWYDLSRIEHQRGSSESKRLLFRRQCLAKLASIAPAYPRNQRTLYSDVGFIFLGAFLEHKTGHSLEALLEQEVSGPLTCKTLCVHPKKRGVSMEQIAATEEVPARGGVIRGSVHDQNAFLWGGLAGHAGLFGTSSDCLCVARAWLDALAGNSDFLSQKTASLFVQKQASRKDEGRALGWDVPTPGASSAGHLISKDAVGHLGYTGTSLWMDMRRRGIVVLLTNRVHPIATNEALKDFRPRFHDLVWGLLDS